MIHTKERTLMSNLFAAITLTFTLFVGTITGAHAETKPRFGFPVDCTLGEDCWILSYVDMDAKGGSATDFRCKSRTYDTHKGTDIALRSMAEMRAGVNVLAAKDGKVARIRDGEDDKMKSRKDIDVIEEQNKNCGNGIMIDHGQAVFSQYCHLKNGSITVQPGDEVKQGDVIAQIGNSGATEMPHLHISFYWEDAIMDPFTGRTVREGCGDVKSVMWEQPIPYQHAALYDGGFLDSPPDFKDIEEGKLTPPEEISSASSAIVFWAAFLGVEEGDLINLSVYTEDGKLALQRNIEQDKTRARQYYTLGKRFRTRNIPAGTYTGIATLKRDGFDDIRKSFEILVR